MNKNYFLILLIILIFHPFQEAAKSDSNYYIKRMMESPSSKFDLYIYKLSENLKCRMDRVSLSKTTQAKTPCMTDIEYDMTGNTLIMYFYVDSSNKNMRNFRGQNKKKKEKTMSELVKNLAIELGVEGQKVGDEVIRLGTIQLTPLTYYNSSDQSYGENVEFYSEIADITEINLVTNIKSKVYKATRQKSGNYIYNVDKSGE